MQTFAPLPLRPRRLVPAGNGLTHRWSCVLTFLLLLLACTLFAPSAGHAEDGVRPPRPPQRSTAWRSPRVRIPEQGHAPAPRRHQTSVLESSEPAMICEPALSCPAEAAEAETADSLSRSTISTRLDGLPSPRSGSLESKVARRIAPRRFVSAPYLASPPAPPTKQALLAERQEELSEKLSQAEQTITRLQTETVELRRELGTLRKRISTLERIMLTQIIQATPQDRRQLQDAIELAEERLEYSRRMYEKGYTSEWEVSADEYAVERAKLRLELAQMAADQAEFAESLQLFEAQARLDVALRRLQQSEKLAARGFITNNQLRADRLNVERARNTVKAIRTRLEASHNPANEPEDSDPQQAPRPPQANDEPDADDSSTGGGPSSSNESGQTSSTIIQHDHPARSFSTIIQQHRPARSYPGPSCSA